MNPTIHSRLLPPLLTSAVLVAALGACGGGGGSKPKAKPSPTPTGIVEAEVNALKLDTPRPAVERRFGKPFDPRGRIPAGYITGEPKHTTCIYYTVKGGTPRDFFQFCFKRGKLASKLSLTTPPKPQAGAGGT